MILFLCLLLCLLINILIFIYLKKLEKKKCECSRNWNHQFLKLFSVLSIIIFLFAITFKIININIKPNKLFIILYNIYFVLGLVNIYLLYKYTKNMKNSKCRQSIECSESKETKFFYYYSYTILIFYCLVTTHILLKQNF